MIDDEGRVVCANPACADAVRRAANSLKGQPLREHVAAELADWLDTLAQPLSGPAVQEFRDPGFIGLYVMTVTDLVGADGHRSGRVIVARPAAGGGAA